VLDTEGYRTSPSTEESPRGGNKSGLYQPPRQCDHGAVRHRSKDNVAIIVYPDHGDVVTGASTVQTLPSSQKFISSVCQDRCGFPGQALPWIMFAGVSDIGLASYGCGRPSAVREQFEASARGPVLPPYGLSVSHASGSDTSTRPPIRDWRPYDPLIAVAFALALSLPLPALAQDTSADLRAQIQMMSQAWHKAYNAGDAAAVAALYMKDATVMAPGAEAATGTKAIRSLFAADIAQGAKNTLTPKDVVGFGDYALETGGGWPPRPTASIWTTART
jgi:hypothetical protein